MECVLSNQTSTCACRDQPIVVAQTRESRRSVFRQMLNNRTSTGLHMSPLRCLIEGLSPL